VKNTFICLEGDGDMTPPIAFRRRAATADAAIFLEGCYAREMPFQRSCEELVRMLDNGGLEAESAIQEVESRVGELVSDDEGVQVVCQALSVGGCQQTAAMIEALRGHVVEVAKSHQAHIILLEALRLQGTVAAAVIVEELLCQAPSSLLNGPGCAVLTGLLEHMGHDGRTACLLERFLSQGAAAVCCHKYGHLVAVAAVTFAPAWQALQITAALSSNLQRLSRHRFAYQVFLAVFQNCPMEVYHPLVLELVSAPPDVAALVCHNFGVQLVRPLLHSPLYSKHIIQCLKQNSRRLMKDKYGRQVLVECGLASATAVAAAAKPGRGARADLA